MAVLLAFILTKRSLILDVFDLNYVEFIATFKIAIVLNL